MYPILFLFFLTKFIYIKYTKKYTNGNTGKFEYFAVFVIDF